MTRTGEVDFSKLLGFRVAVRRFLHWSEEQAKSVGLTASQHQLLLCIRGSDGPPDPAIGDIAECLMLRHHSAVELVDRAELAGVVVRHSDPEDARVIRVRLTAKGSKLLLKLTDAHLEELRRLGALLKPIVGDG
jgi:DNA-binding MarR family transcriptional regulator